MPLQSNVVLLVFLLFIYSMMRTRRTLAYVQQHSLRSLNFQFRNHRVISLPTISSRNIYSRGRDVHPNLWLHSSSSSSDTSDISSSSSTQRHPSTIKSLKGIHWIRNTVADVLNESFDYKQVAKSIAMEKLEPNKKKKQKKNKSQNDTIAQPLDESGGTDTNILSEEEKTSILQQAMEQATPFQIQDTMITPATKLEFGDYQCNAAMSLAKPLNMSPRECATIITKALMPLIQDVMEEPEIAGPGFINLKFKREYLSEAISQMAADPQRLAVPKSTHPQKIVVDFSSPNIAKEMHVGHLRSTIIGDTLSNVLGFAGHTVKRLNHIGDWGTQFGMLVEHLRDEYPAALKKETSQNVDLGDLVMLYKAAKKRFDDDDKFKVRAREGVVKLQAGDQEALAAWESLCAASRLEYQKVSEYE